MGETRSGCAVWSRWSRWSCAPESFSTAWVGGKLRINEASGLFERTSRPKDCREAFKAKMHASSQTRRGLLLKSPHFAPVSWREILGVFERTVGRADHAYELLDWTISPRDCAEVVIAGKATSLWLQWG